MRTLNALIQSAILLSTLAGVNAAASNLHFELLRDGAHRIVGGTELTSGERPWMVSLQHSGEHFCGGSLIAPSWVLTAAHCVEGDASGLQVRANFIDLRDTSEGQSAVVSEVYIHPEYPSNEAADIALLRLGSPISNVPTLSLADESFMSNYAPAGTMASVSGWGDTGEGGQAPDRLLYTDVPLVSRAQCNAPQAYDGQIADTEICAGYQRGGKDSCQGDSGGPLVTLQQGEYVQVGVVSWGDGCALPNKYGVYARVASFNNWVSGVQSGNSVAIDNTPSMTPPVNGTLQNGVVVTPLAGETGDRLSFQFDVAADAVILFVDIRGGSGDADLMLAYDRNPTWDDLDYAPYLDGNSEHIVIRNPSSGRWHIAVDGYQNFDNVELVVFSR